MTIDHLWILCVFTGLQFTAIAVGVVAYKIIVKRKILALTQGDKDDRL